MKEMTISCLPDGTVQHTLKDGFLKFDMGATREVTRMSEILHCGDRDDFYIKLGSFLGSDNYIYEWSGAAVRISMLREFDVHTMLADYAHAVDWHEEDNIVVFPRYEDAVEIEIALINAMRLKGYKFYDQRR